MDIAALTFAAVERVEAFASDIKAVVSTCHATKSEPKYRNSSGRSNSETRNKPV
jgi:hypothetical protein